MSEEESQDTEETSELLGRQGSNNMEARHDHQVLKKFRLFHATSIVVGVLLIIAIVTWVFNYLGGLAWSANPKVQFNWHPILMTIGMIFLYGQSILLYRAGKNTRKRPLKIFHGLMNFLAFILSVIGLQAVFDSHNLADPPIANMYSLHSWIGLTTVILFACQFVAGFVSFFYPGLPMDLRSSYMPVHVNFGTATFLLALITAVMGIYEKLMFRQIATYSNLNDEAVLVNLAGIVLVFFGVVVLYMVTEPEFKRRPLPEDDLVSLNQPGIAEPAE